VEINDVFRNVAYLGYIVLAINTFIYFKSYRDKSVAFKIFSFYLILCLLIQLTTSVFRLYKIDNLFLSHFYFIGQFVLMSLFFKQLLKGIAIKKMISIVLILVLIFSGFYYIIDPFRFLKFNIYEIAATSIPLIVYSFVFFIQRVNKSEKTNLYINSGFFLYLLCSTLLFTTGNIEASIKRFIWYSNVTLYLLYQILIFIEWYKHFRKNKVVV